MNLLDPIQSISLFMSVSMWAYAIISDHFSGNKAWAFFSFWIFPIGILRGLYLSFE